MTNDSSTRMARTVEQLLIAGDEMDKRKIASKIRSEQTRIRRQNDKLKLEQEEEDEDYE
jgi:hypothetical protein